MFWLSEFNDSIAIMYSLALLIGTPAFVQSTGEKNLKKEPSKHSFHLKKKIH